MSGKKQKGALGASVKTYPGKLEKLRERLLADAVMIGEIPAPTFKEEALVRFLADRFTEEGLDQVTVYERPSIVARTTCVAR